MSVLGEWGGALKEAADDLRDALGVFEPTGLHGVGAVDWSRMGASPQAPQTAGGSPFPDYSRLMQPGGGLPEMQPVKQPGPDYTNLSFDDFSRLAGDAFGQDDLRDLYALYDRNTEQLRRSREAREAAASGQAGGGYSNVSSGDASSARGMEGALKWKDLAVKVAATVGIPWQVILAVMGAESGGDQHSVSVAGAQGLMQVMPFHFGSGDDMLDPFTNVMKGAQILKDNYDRYGSWDQAFAAYLGAIDANGNITSAQDAYGTTGQDYVRLVDNNLAYLGFGGVGGNGGGTTGNERLDRVVQFALQAQGKPYVWGGANIDGGFDCSGLVQWAYAQANVALPRTALEQYDATRRIDKSQLRNGDLVFYSNTYAGAPAISHVGIYINGKVLNAVNEGDVVRFVELDDPWWSAHVAGYGRVPMGATLALAAHTGVDRPARAGTPVNAVRGGQVIGRGVTPELGQYVTLFDGRRFYTYGHLGHEGIPPEGEWVDAGDYVGAVGNGGLETGPHTHLDVHDLGGNPLDPWRFVRL